MNDFEQALEDEAKENVELREHLNNVINYWLRYCPQPCIVNGKITKECECDMCEAYFYIHQPIGYQSCWKEGPNYQYKDIVGHCRKPKGHDGDCSYV